MLPFMAYCPLVLVSAKTGFNIHRSIEAVDHVAAQVQATLPTGVLNRTLMDAFDRVQPPMVNGKRLKVFYASQVGVKPLRIRIFANDPRAVPPAYRGFLIRNLREKFGLEGAPINLYFSARSRPEPDGSGNLPRRKGKPPDEGGSDDFGG